MTPFEKVFKYFFLIIEDDIYFLAPQESALEELTEILKFSLPEFLYPRIPLDYDEYSRVFLNELEMAEIRLIAMLMKQVWMDRIIATVDNLDPAHKDKDYSSGKTEGYLGRIINFAETHRKNVKQEKLNYNRAIKGKFNVSKLAGKNQ